MVFHEQLRSIDSLRNELEVECYRTQVGMSTASLCLIAMLWESRPRIARGGGRRNTARGGAASRGYRALHSKQRAKRATTQSRCARRRGSESYATMRCRPLRGLMTFAYSVPKFHGTRSEFCPIASCWGILSTDERYPPRTLPTAAKTHVL